MIEFTCTCGMPLCLADDLAGRMGRCPSCHLFVCSPGVPTVSGADQDLERLEFLSNPRLRRLPPRLREATRYIYTNPTTAGALMVVTVSLLGFVLLLPMVNAFYHRHGAQVAKDVVLREHMLRAIGWQSKWPIWAILLPVIAGAAALRLSGRHLTGRLLDIYVMYSGDTSDDLVGYAKSGVFDIENWAPLVSLWAVAAIFWITYNTPLGAPIEWLTGPWTVVLVLAMLNHTLPVCIAKYLFHARFGPPRSFSALVSQQPIASPHIGDVYVCRFSPDGRLVVSGSADNVICFWDGYSGQRVAVLNTPNKTTDQARQDRHSGQTLLLVGAASEQVGLIVAAAFSPDGRFLASGGLDPSVRIWSVAARREVGSVRTPTPLHYLAYDPDGSCLVGAGDDGRIYLWRGSAEPIALGQVGSGIRWLAVGTGHLVAARHIDNSLKVWNTEANAVLWSQPGGEGPIAFSSDGRILVSGNQSEPYADNAQIHLLDSRDGSRFQVLAAGEGHLHAMAFSAGGTELGASVGGSLLLWDVETGNLLERMPIPTTLEDLWFDPDGGVLKAVDRGGETRFPRVRRFELPSLSLRH